MVYNGVTTSKVAGSERNLLKALYAGYGTDSVSYINGRAMIPEDCEVTLMNVMAALKEDCKLFNSLKKQPMTSTVHEFNRRTAFGNHRFASVAEGAEVRAADQAIERKIVEAKYFARLRGVTTQMEVVQTFEDAYASEKIAGVQDITLAVEHTIIHGNADIIPEDFDGFIASIKKSVNPNIFDARGRRLSRLGEGALHDIAAQVWDKGGNINKALYPAIVSKDIYDLMSDRYRFLPQDARIPFVKLPDFVTAIGSTIKLTGDDAGADKLYHVKGVVNAIGDSNERPIAPASVSVAAVSDAAGSQFAADDEGDYLYTVYAVNASGISEGASPAAAVTVAEGGAVNITITPNTSRPVTGFIIARSAPNGSVIMEMAEIKNSGLATTVYQDLNKDLPGTASMLFLTEQRILPCYSFAQLMPITTVPMYPTNRLITPFIVALFGALEVRAPEFCGLIDNLAYTGGLYG